MTGSATAAASESPPPLAGMAWFGPDPGWRIVDFRELWNYRELLLVFAVRDLKVRYRQAVVGIAWAILQPVATMLVFVVLFGWLGRRPAAEGAPYGLLAYIGMLVWQLFAYSVREGSSSLVGNRDLVTKVYFPRLLLPAATVVCALVDFLIALLVLIPLMIAFNVSPSARLLLLPAFLSLAILAALAGSLWAAALNALYRDIGYVIPFLLQLGFFAAPVVYQTDALVPERWRWLWGLNPLAATIEGCRWSIVVHPGVSGPDWKLLPVAAIVTLAVLIAGLAYLRRVERWIADRI